jgi:uncharacterized membrane protein
MSAAISATGLVWYDREDYPRILEVMKDAHVLPDTYDQWRKKAENVERGAQHSGALVVRAVIKPEQFLAWCTIRGLNVDAKARNAFAAEFARNSLGDH